MHFDSFLSAIPISRSKVSGKKGTVNKAARETELAKIIA